MTLTETDRLIRGLRETLKGPAIEVGAGTANLAQQYADNCNSLSHRLELCAAMLDQGDEQQAIQLAETEPPALDLLTLLSFGEAPAWRAYCQVNRLPVAPSFDPRIVQRLNAVYAKGITVNHPLYRDYRAHIMKNRVDEAATALRSIVRLNPSDSNARQELERLEEKTLQRDLEKLAKAVFAGDEHAAVALVDQLEEQRFAGSTRPQGAAWEQGLTMRREQFKRHARAEARATLAQIAPLQTADKWGAAGPMLAHIKALQTEHGFALDAEEAHRLADIQAWLNRSQKENAQQKAFQATLAELESLIEEGEQRQAAAGVSGLPALRAELAALVAKWREVEAFERPLRDGLEQRYRKRVGLTRSEIDRLQKVRRNAWVVSSAAAVLACAAGIYFFVQHQRSMDLAEQFHRLVETRRVGATEKLLVEARANDSKLFGNASVRAAAGEAETFVQSAHARQQEFNSNLTALTALAAEQPTPFVSRPPEAIQLLLTDTQKRLDALPPEFQTAALAPMAAFRNRWEAFLTHESGERNERFAAALAETEKLADAQLSYRRSPEELRQSLTALTAALGPLTSQAQSPPVAALKVRDDLTARVEATASKVGAFTTELAKFDAALKAMRDANTLEAYLTALQVGQDSELRGARDLAPSKRILDIHPSVDALLSASLLPGNPDGWAFLKANPTVGLMPTSAVLDPERRIYDQLLVDVNIRNVYSYQVRDSQGKVGTIFSRGELESDSGTINGEKPKPKGSYYQPSQFPKALAFSDGTVDGTIIKTQLAPDSQAFLDLKFRDLINTDADRFNPGQGAPLLEFFDRLTRHPSATPLFKAYLYARVYQLMLAGRRSDFWGFLFTPALPMHGKQINNIGGTASGYWMVPDEIAHKGAAFGQLFAAIAKVSYAQQARVFQVATREAANAGMTYRGFIDASGQSEFIGHETESGGAQPDLWGWTARDGQPARLFAWSAKDTQYKPTADPAPLTPLFVPERNPQEVLQEACKHFALSADDYKNSIEPFLPPFFKQ